MRDYHEHSTKKVRARSFQVRDQVLTVRRPIVMTHRVKSKFAPKWENPYIVHEIYSNGAYKAVGIGV